ncbi:MAG: acyl-CoA thioesterase [Pirellulaceae bacterium]|nr:acyl-CoA thioesterase [Pirellulaceae bacterium]
MDRWKLPKGEPLRDYPVYLSLALQWGDHDNFGHVNNTRHFLWFESARITYLEEAGLGYMMTGKSIGPILAKVDCSYRLQLKYPDVVQIGASVTKLGRKSMVMEHAVYSHNQNAIVASGASVIVMYDYPSQESIHIPDEVRETITTLQEKVGS